MRLRNGCAAAAFSAATLSLCVCARPLLGVDCSVQDTLFAPSIASVFTITTAGFSNAEIQTAADYWACPGYSGAIPTFQIGGPGGIPVIVVKKVGNSTAENGSCGEARLEIVNGHLEGASITVWTKDVFGASCEPLTDTLAHEFGHLMGEAHAPSPFGACLGHIMGNTFVGGTRTVFADDCAVADQMWETPQETPPPDDPWCSAYCWTDCVNNVCPPGTHPGCPILIDVENDGIHLTGLDDPVWFDIDADGDMELMSWTNQGEGLLALDRNGNGSIDDGGELFGDATVLASGARAANGYLALAELDSWVFGGNGDGQIDAGDAAFASLRLWVDEDHSGTSRPGELLTLAAAGIRQIGLDYRMSRRRDRHGNDFRFLGRAWKEGRRGVVRPVLTWDVFFLAVD